MYHESDEDVKHLVSNEDHVRATLAFYHGPGDCFEVRAIGSYRGRKIIDAGFFDDREKAVLAVLGLVKANRHDALYLTMNPVDEALLARACNRIKTMGEGELTADKDVHVLRRLLIDIDVERPAKISSTDDEHDFAIEHARRVERELSAEGWPKPLMGDSGNGAHLVYRLPDLPNTVENVDLIKRVLQGLAKKFAAQKAATSLRGGVTLKIDEKVFNPSRISKIYGTLAKKGDHTKKRPHRWARILSREGW